MQGDTSVTFSNNLRKDQVCIDLGKDIVHNLTIFT